MIVDDTANLEDHHHYTMTIDYSHCNVGLFCHIRYHK